MLPTHATHPTGGYATETGIMEMLNRMRSDRFKVGAGLTEWQDEFQSYHRKEGLIVKEYDDLMSATRIGVMQLRSARNVGLGSTRRNISSQSTMARGVNDWNIFDPSETERW